jgi:hypothetical protein
MQETAVMAETLLRKSVVQMNSQSRWGERRLVGRLWGRRWRELTEVLPEEEQRNQVEGQAEELRDHHESVEGEKVSRAQGNPPQLTCATF